MPKTFLNISLNNRIDDIFMYLFDVPGRTFKHLLQVNRSILASSFYFDVETQMTVNFTHNFEVFFRTHKNAKFYWLLLTNNCGRIFMGRFFLSKLNMILVVCNGFIICVPQTFEIQVVIHILKLHREECGLIQKQFHLSDFQLNWRLFFSFALVK